jgi:hypothetical protein
MFKISDLHRFDPTPVADPTRVGCRVLAGCFGLFRLHALVRIAGPEEALEVERPDHHTEDEQPHHDEQHAEHRPQDLDRADPERLPDRLCRRDHRRIREHERVPRHVELDVVCRVVPPHHLIVRPDAHNEEPQAEPPHPQSRQVGEDFEEEPRRGVALIPVRHDLRHDHVAEVHDAGYCEAAGADGDELWMSAEL